MQQYGSQSNFVELKVPICCDNCERKVRACLEHMDGKCLLPSNPGERFVISHHVIFSVVETVYSLVRGCQSVQVWIA